MSEEKQRMIQEYVPGKQITLAHVIAGPNRDLYQKLGLSDEYMDAVGIMTITPSEAAIIAADVATKAGNVSIGFIDRFSGSLVLIGDVSSIEESMENVISMLKHTLDFNTSRITKS